MASIPRQVNYVKLVQQASKAKTKVRENEVAVYLKWHKKMGKKAAKLDRIEERLRRILKALKAIDRSRKERSDATIDLIDIIQGTHRELEAFKLVPVPGTFPELPKNFVVLQSMVLFVEAAIVYTALVKVYMACSEALSCKTD